MEFDKTKFDRIVQIRRNLLHNIDNLAQNSGAGEPTTYLDHQTTLPHGYEVSAAIFPENNLIPNKLIAFLQKQYVEVPITLGRISAGLSYVSVGVKWPEADPHSFQDSGGDFRIYIPELDTVLDYQVFIFPDRYPMMYAIKNYSMAEWIRTRTIPFQFSFEENECDPEIVQELADMIRPPKYTPTFAGNMARRLNIVPFTEKDFQIFAAVEGRPNFQTLKASDQWST